MAGSGWDVVGEYQAQYPDKVHKDSLPDDKGLLPLRNMAQSMPKVAQTPLSPAEKNTFDRKNEKITVDKRPACAYSDVSNGYQPASEAEKLLLDRLGNTVWQVDELIAQTGLPAGKVLSMLTLLEIKGQVSRLPGRQVKRRNKP